MSPQDMDKAGLSLRNSSTALSVRAKSETQFGTRRKTPNTPGRETHTTPISAVPPQALRTFRLPQHPHCPISTFQPRVRSSPAGRGWEQGLSLRHCCPYMHRYRITALDASHCKFNCWQKILFCHLYSPILSYTTSTFGSPRWDVKLINRKHCLPKAAYSRSIPGQSSRNVLLLTQKMCKNCKHKETLLCAAGCRPVSFVA